MRVPGFGLGLVLAGIASAALGGPKVANFGAPRVPNQLIVKFAHGLDGAASLARIKGLTGQGGRILHRFRSSGAILVEFPPAATSLQDLAHQLAQDPSVHYVEANVILHVDRTPNDPRFGDLYGMFNDGSQNGKVGADVGALKAWDISTGSKAVKVAVIDTGIDYTHPDIAPNYWTNPGESGVDAEGNDKATNGVDDDGNGYVDDVRGWNFVANNNDPFDDNGHGTHTAGTIGAAGDDGYGVVGVNWQVSLVAAKFLDASGSGTLADAVKAIEYTTALGVDMTSNSWGGGGFSDTMSAAIEEADKKGVLFVAAAGNDHSNNDRDPHYPSSYEWDNVIAVAALDRADQMARFSSYGATSVDVGAPGVGIWSTVPGEKFEKLSGTSMATPHVTGVAALIKAVYPAATHREIKQRLLNTVDPVDGLAGKTLTGGRVNAFSALEQDVEAPNAATALTVSNPGINSFALAWQAAGDDGDRGSASRYEVRLASQPILTDDDWARATPARLRRTILSGDGQVSTEVYGLPFNAAGFAAIKAFDNVGNQGPLSVSVPYEVRDIMRVYENAAESLEGVTVDDPWGLEAVPGRGQVFSDSPGGEYGEQVDAALTLSPIKVTDPNMVLTFDTAFRLEESYDFGAIEVKTDQNDAWTTIDSLTGASDWVTKAYDLTGLLDNAQTFQVRFRLYSDGSINQDGWQIDNIAVLGPKD